jgi:PhzF family phenazine biosynthesis protein
MIVTVYTLNAFAKTKYGGNPAGVVLDADLLSEPEMQHIAAKVGFSETAFVRKSDKADYQVRFFTPSSEVDLCGYATVATFYLLARKGIIQAGEFTQETKAGILKVENRPDGIIYMNQIKPVFYEEIDKKIIAESLNINEDAIMKDLPVRILSTGLKDILVPVTTLKEISNIRPDFNKVAAVSKKYCVTGYHIFTLETMYSSTAHCRNLAPLFDIPEESATGTSNGALGCYLYKYGIVTEEAARSMVFEQGYSMRQPSEILASLVIENKEIMEVKVGGIAQDIKEKVVEL